MSGLQTIRINNNRVKMIMRKSKDLQQGQQELDHFQHIQDQSQISKKTFNLNLKKN